MGNIHDMDTLNKKKVHIPGGTEQDAQFHYATDHSA
jgi:hypothetical protein